MLAGVALPACSVKVSIEKLRKRLGKSCVRVWNALLRDREQGSTPQHRSIIELAERACVPERTVKRALKKLREAGLLVNLSRQRGQVTWREVLGFVTADKGIWRVPLQTRRWLTKPERRGGARKGAGRPGKGAVSVREVPRLISEFQTNSMKTQAVTGEIKSGPWEGSSSLCTNEELEKSSVEIPFEVFENEEGKVEPFDLHAEVEEKSYVILDTCEKRLTDPPERGVNPGPVVWGGGDLRGAGNAEGIGLNVKGIDFLFFPSEKKKIDAHARATFFSFQNPDPETKPALLPASGEREAEPQVIVERSSTPASAPAPQSSVEGSGSLEAPREGWKASPLPFRPVLGARRAPDRSKVPPPPPPLPAQPSTSMVLEGGLVVSFAGIPAGRGGVPHWRWVIRHFQDLLPWAPDFYGDCWPSQLVPPPLPFRAEDSTELRAAFLAKTIRSAYVAYFEEPGWELSRGLPLAAPRTTKNEAIQSKRALLLKAADLLLEHEIIPAWWVRFRLGQWEELTGSKRQPKLSWLLALQSIEKNAAWCLHESYRMDGHEQILAEERKQFHLRWRQLQQRIMRERPCDERAIAAVVARTLTPEQAGALVREAARFERAKRLRLEQAAARGEWLWR